MAFDFEKFGTAATQAKATAQPVAKAQPVKTQGFNFDSFGSEAQPEPQKQGGVVGFLKNIIQSVTAPVTGLAQAPIRPIVTQQYAKESEALKDTTVRTMEAADGLIAQANQEQDPERKKKLLLAANQAIRASQASRKGFEASAKDLALTADSTGKEFERIGGQALGTALTFAPFAKAGGVAYTGITSASKLKPAFTLPKTYLGAAAEGGAYGAGQGAAQSMSEGGSLGDVAKSSLIGGGVGAIAAPALMATAAGLKKATGAVRSSLAERAATKAEESALLESATPDARIAAKALKDGRVVTDPIGREAVRQGIPEADVALIKTASPSDKLKMSKMLDIRERQLTNKRLTDRATDVVGDSFLNQARFLEQKNKAAAKQLGEVAKGLSGKKVDLGGAMESLLENLDNSGVKVRANGTLNYRGSDFENIKGAQSAINGVFRRAVRVARKGDALQAHRMKSYVDELVEYGKSAEGLSGKAQRILKGFRRATDQALDSTFPEYNQVNTVFADTIGELDKIGQAMGRTFRLGDTFANARAGVVMRRVLSNTQSRSDLLQLLDSMQQVAQKYGAKKTDDIVAQAGFADTLEKILGSEAPTSFLGQISRGLETFGSTSGIQGAQQIASAGSEFARGNVVRGTIKGATAIGEKLMGISQENKVKAIKALLKQEYVQLFL